MSEHKILLSDERFKLTIERLCHQLIENFDNFEDIYLIGIQPRGVMLAERVYKRLLEITGLPKILYGKLDITFYRDDFRQRTKPLKPSYTDMTALVEDKHVILIDDVLYTGRTVQAALTALNHYGRPKEVELLVLVNRRFNRHLPIEPNYTGIEIDTLEESYVTVKWESIDNIDQILFFPDKKARS
ncbi:MAG: bifunctional pyr operon transcriptional regulator/uracil phosphoribosyltransferase PyrR [Bacteroidota bacterium]